MTRGNKILLIVLVVQVGLVVLMLNRDRGGGMARLEEVAPGLDVTKVTKVQIFDQREASAEGDATAAVELTAVGDAWQLSSHFGYPADGGKVVKLLGDLAAMKARGPMTEGVGRHIQLGVADGIYQRKVVVTTDTGDRAFFVGNSAGGKLGAVRRGEDAKVFAVSGISSYAIDPQPRGWVDATYARVATDDIAAIEVTTPTGSVAIDRTAGPWMLIEQGALVTLAAGEAVDAAKADGLLNGLATISLVEPADPARATAPTATITLRKKAPPPPVVPAPTPGDAGVAPTPVPAPISEPPPPPQIFDVVADGERYWLHERGNPRAVLVDKSVLDGVLGISRATVVTKAEPAPAPPAPSPG